MALAVWPPSLKSLADIGTWNWAPNSELRPTDFDQGPGRSRRQFTRQLRQASFSIIMSDSDFLLFESFFNSTINQGADKFVMPVWRGGSYESITVKFQPSSPYTAGDFALLFVQVKMNFVVFDAPLLDAGAAYLFGLYGEDFVFSAIADPLQIAVNVNWPHGAARFL